MKRGTFTDIKIDRKLFFCLSLASYEWKSYPSILIFNPADYAVSFKRELYITESSSRNFSIKIYSDVKMNALETWKEGSLNF